MSGAGDGHEKWVIMAKTLLFSRMAIEMMVSVAVLRGGAGDGHEKWVIMAKTGVEREVKAMKNRKNFVLV